MILQNKNVLITGASGGLGRSLAFSYQRMGCNLILTGRKLEVLQTLHSDLSKVNSLTTVTHIKCDLGDESSVYRLIKDVKDRLGRVDVLVNCAGVFPIDTIHDMSIEAYSKCIRVNLTVPFILSKEFSREMIEAGWGRIVNIASSSAYGGSPKTSAYCASKHGLLGLSRSLHKELKDQGVRVLCVSPGSIKTEMGKEVEKLGQRFDTFMDPDEVADYIVYNTALNKDMISEEIKLNRIFVQ